MFSSRILITTLVSSGLALLLTACNGSDATPSNGDGAAVAESKLERNLNPQSTTQQQQSLATQNNDFAFDMFEKLQEEERNNIFFSPYSISEALVMTYAGAKGTTQSQMATALHFDHDNQALHNNFNALDLHLNYTDSNYTLSVANSLWPDKDYTFLERYLDTIKENYGAKMRLLDYTNETEKSRQIINSWVEEKTHDRIKNLIPAGLLSPLTKLTLVNAVYFKGRWENDFSEYNTQNDTFSKEDGSTMETPFMNQTDSFNYKENDDFQAISLPYKEGRTSMIVVLPKDGKQSRVINTINTIYSDILATSSNKKVQLKMPKFEFTTDLYHLKEPFQKLGMIDAFDANVADFSDMTGKRDLLISDILHKAFIKVDENGSEAAAATAVIMDVTSIGPIDTPPPVEMFVTRPFIFFIKDDMSGQILFMGLVKEPTVKAL